MRLLVDEDTQAKTLVRLLVEAGHDVLTVEAVGMNGQPDALVLERAAREARTLLTRNCGDFLALHAANPAHAGVLAVYQDGDPTRCMSYREIVSAIANVENSGVDPSGEFIALNAWRW